MEEIGVPDVEIILNGKKTFLEIGISEDEGNLLQCKKKEISKIKALRM
jgi:hypothetical protein